MNYFVQLREDSWFFGIFEGGRVPVKQVPAPNTWKTRGVPAMVFVTAALCGNAPEPEPCLWLDWTRLSTAQRTNLAGEVCKLRGGTLSEFFNYMDRGGDMPIRVSQTVNAPFPL